MEALRSFFMEDHLERSRFEARFNLGESGHRHRTVGELIRGVGLDEAEAFRTFSGTLLRDSPNWGRPDLRTAVAQMHEGASIENVLITTGTSEALLLLFRQLRPAKVALIMPAFQLLYEIPQSLGASMVGLTLKWDEQGVPHVPEDDWFETLERERPDCIVINNPQNPSGVVLEHRLLERMLAFADRTGAALIADEHYRFLSSEEAVLGETLFRPGKRVFVTGSFIKCLGCPGLRIGWCVGDPLTLAAMQNEKNYTTHTVNPITEWISFEVLKHLDSPVMREARQEWQKNRATLGQFLAQSRALYGVAPAGGIVTCIGLRQAESDEQYALIMRRIAEAGVFVLPLESMEFATPDATHPLGRGHGFRLGVGIAPEAFPAALESMEKAGVR